MSSLVASSDSASTIAGEILATAVETIGRIGAATYNAIEFAGPPDGWHRLADEWRSMPTDAYLPDGATYRRRQYGRIEAVRGDVGWALRTLVHEAFCQSEDVVPLYGGRARLFAPIPESVIRSRALRGILEFDLDLVSRLDGGSDHYVVGLHMVRVIASSSSDVSPAPEGRHRDGHAFVVMHLIDRAQCIGGASRVFDESGLVFETTMGRVLDSIIVDDRRVEHEVSPITATSMMGWRDTLLVDFDHLQVGA
jgi:hypothetical protein